MESIETPAVNKKLLLLSAIGSILFHHDGKEEISDEELGNLLNLTSLCTKSQTNGDNKCLNENELESLVDQIIMSARGEHEEKSAVKDIVRLTGQALKADRCYLMQYKPETTEIIAVKDYEVYLSSIKIKDMAGKTFTKEELSPFFRMIEQGQVLYIENIDEVTLPEATRAVLNEYNIKSYMAALVSYRDNPIGILAVDYVRGQKQFTQKDVNLFSAIVKYSSVVLNQAQIHDQLIKTNEREQLVNRITINTLKSKNIEEAVEKTTAEIGKLFGVDRVSFRLYDNGLKSFTGIIAEYRRNEAIPSVKEKIIPNKDFDRYLYEELFIKDKILIINDSDDTKYPESVRNALRDYNVKSAVAFPVHYNDEPEGIFFITNTHSSKRWNVEDINDLIPIFQQISIGIHLFLLNDNLLKYNSYDKIMRDIIIEVRKFEDPDDIFIYLIDQLADIFHINRVLNLQPNGNGDLAVKREELKEGIESLYEQVIFKKEDFNKLPNLEEIVIVNDLNDTQSQEITDCLRRVHIESFLLYPIYDIIPELGVEKVVDRIMLCSSKPRLWTTSEAEALKLIVGTVALIYVEVRNRLKIKDLRETFLATLTHDLKSPLIAEQKALEMILSGKSGTSLENFSEYLEDIKKTNDELLQMVNNILSVYHYEEGKFELNIQETNIAELIKTSVCSMKLLAKDQGSEINTNIQPDLPPVRADREEILRVINNLISNAIKHNAKGTTIKVSARKTDSEVEVAVSDNGSGIPELEKPNIFQRYPTTKRKIGTGLGLYLSKQIVDAHHGRIWFETEEGKGTTFFFSLPIS